MKQIVKHTLICLSFAAITNMTAQNANDEIKIIQGMYGMEKKEIVKQYFKVSETEAPKFWAFYDQYETERQKLGKDRLNIINDYATAYNNLKPEQADNLMNRVLDNEIEFAKLYKKHYAKLKTDLGPVRAASFFQLESYLHTMVKAEIQDNIPFIGELDKTVKPSSN